MADNQKGDFTLEEILAEQREKKQVRESAPVSPQKNSNQPVKAKEITSSQPQKVTAEPKPNSNVQVKPNMPTKNAEENQKGNDMPKAQPAQKKAEPKNDSSENLNKKLNTASKAEDKSAQKQENKQAAAQNSKPNPVQKQPNKQKQKPVDANQATPQKQVPPAKQKKQKAAKPANPQGELLNSETDNATEDINLYATGNIKSSDLEKPKKKKKGGLFGWFGRKKKVPDFDESDDMFYGLQLKPIDEYRKGFNTGEIPVKDTFAALFDETKEEIDEDVAENFRKLEEQRRNRVEQAMKSSGMNETEIESELGFVAPMPVSSFAADPYTKQKGTDIEGMSSSTGEIPDFQKAQLKSLQNNDQTMQFKLNVLNDTIEIESLNDAASVSDASVEKILSSAPKNADDFADDATKVIPKMTEEVISQQNRAEKPQIKPNNQQNVVSENKPPVVAPQNRAEKPQIRPNNQPNVVAENNPPVVPPQNRAEKPQVRPNNQQNVVAENKPPVAAPQNRAEKPQIRPNNQQNVVNENNATVVAPQNRTEKPQIRPNNQQNVNALVAAPQNRAEKPQIRPNNQQNVVNENKPPVVAPQNRAEKPQIRPNNQQNAVNESKPPVVAPQNRAEKPQVRPNNQQNVVAENKPPVAVPQNRAEKPKVTATIPSHNTPNLENAILNELKNKDISAPQVRAEKPIISAPKPVQKKPKKSIDRPVQKRAEVLAEIPQVDSPFKYREKGVPMHVLNTDISAVLDFSVSQAAPTAQAPAPTYDKPEPVAVKNSLANRKKKLRETDKNKNLKATQDANDYENPESIEDYTSPDDAHSIAAEMKRDMRDLTIRMMITGAVTAILILLNIFLGGKLSEETGNTAVIYAGLSFVFLASAVVGCFRTVLNGLKAMFTFNANSDSAVAVASVAAMAQSIFAMFMKNALFDGSLSIYAAVVTGLLFVNAAGKLTMLRRIHSNFRFVTSREQKYAVNILNNYGMASKMTKNVISGKPVVAYQVKTGFLRRFLEISYRPDPCEVSSQMLAPVGLIASLVLCIICMVITKNVPMAINAFTAGLIVSVCAGNMLAINLPISRLAKLARRAGAMVSGYESVRLAGDVNAVVLDADELFPKGTVVLDGIKTYTPRGNVEEVIMCASALVNKVGGTLGGVFEQVIMEKEDHLPDVSHYSYEDDSGLIGMVDGKITYIGNRALLIKHKIEPPPREDEAPYTAANKHMVYIAQDNTVIAMLVLSYTADRRRKNELHRMEDSGISIVIKTTDPNITPQFVGRLFSIDPHSISVLDDSLGQAYTELTNKEVPRSDATIATKGRIESLMTVLGACVSSKRDASLVVALQNIGAVLGFLLVAFLSCFGAISKLTVFPLFLFELVWLLIMLIVPRMRKP